MRAVTNRMNFILQTFCILALSSGLTLFSSCGEDKEETTVLSFPQERPTGTSTAAVIAIPPGAAELGDDAYGPNPLLIDPGITIEWVNADVISHTVTSDDGLFRSGVLAPGERFTYRFDSSGYFPYHCELHPSMQGSVQVRSTF